jgi:hypothetical protein
MNENMSKEQVSQNGQMPSGMCPMCGHGMCHHHRFFWLRWLLGIVILALVFSVGIKVGEFKGEFGNGHFGSRGGYNMMYRQGSPMMRTYNQVQPWGTVQVSPANPITPTASTTPKK